MSVRVGWPLGTLATFVVGYVAAVAVVPPEGSGVPGGPDAAMPPQHVEAPIPIPPMGALSALASMTESAPFVETSVAPPPLRGSRASFDPEDGPDWGFTSPPEVQGATIQTRRSYGHADATGLLMVDAP